jgi:hypothetical protein
MTSAIKIVRGNPDDGETAAVTVVLAALAAATRPEPPTGPERAPWVRPARFQPPGGPAGPGWW